MDNNNIYQTSSIYETNIDPTSSISSDTMFYTETTMIVGLLGYIVSTKKEKKKDIAIPIDLSEELHKKNEEIKKLKERLLKQEELKSNDINIENIQKIIDLEKTIEELADNTKDKNTDENEKLKTQNIDLKRQNQSLQKENERLKNAQPVPPAQQSQPQPQPPAQNNQPINRDPADIAEITRLKNAINEIYNELHPQNSSMWDHVKSFINNPTQIQQTDKIQKIKQEILDLEGAFNEVDKENEKIKKEKNELQDKHTKIQDQHQELNKKHEETKNTHEKLKKKHEAFVKRTKNHSIELTKFKESILELFPGIPEQDIIDSIKKLKDNCKENQNKYDALKLEQENTKSELEQNRIALDQKTKAYNEDIKDVKDFIVPFFENIPEGQMKDLLKEYSDFRTFLHTKDPKTSTKCNLTKFIEAREKCLKPQKNNIDAQPTDLGKVKIILETLTSDEVVQNIEKAYKKSDEYNAIFAENKDLKEINNKITTERQKIYSELKIFIDTHLIAHDINDLTEDNLTNLATMVEKHLTKFDEKKLKKTCVSFKTFLEIKDQPYDGADLDGKIHLIEDKLTDLNKQIEVINKKFIASGELTQPNNYTIITGTIGWDRKTTILTFEFLKNINTLLENHSKRLF